MSKTLLISCLLLKQGGICLGKARLQGNSHSLAGEESAGLIRKGMQTTLGFSGPSGPDREPQGYHKNFQSLMVTKEWKHH